MPEAVRLAGASPARTNKPFDFGPQRRITTFHGPHTSADQWIEPPVLVHTELIQPEPITLTSSSGASQPTSQVPHIAPLWSNSHPAVNTYSFDSRVVPQTDQDPNGDQAKIPNGRLVLPGGSNIQVTDIPPNVYVGMHRTTSVDYNIVVKGSGWLIVPAHDYDPETSKPPSPHESNCAEHTYPSTGTRETRIEAGDIVIQRGTLHAWRAGPEGCRWISVLVDAKPLAVDDGKHRGKILEPVCL